MHLSLAERPCMKDHDLAGRSASVTTDFNIELVRELLRSNRRLTCEDMAQELEISVGSVRIIIRNRL